MISIWTLCIGAITSVKLVLSNCHAMHNIVYALKKGLMKLTIFMVVCVVSSK